MSLNAVSGFREGRADESTAGVVDCKEATNSRERVGKACTRPLSNQRETKRPTVDENQLASMGVANHHATGAAYPELGLLLIRVMGCSQYVRSHRLSSGVLGI